MDVGGLEEIVFTSTKRLNSIIIFYKYFLLWLITQLLACCEGLARKREVGVEGPPLLRCACGPKWKPIKVRFMFIKCLSKLKNFLINSNLAAPPRWLGVPPRPRQPLPVTTLGENPLTITLG